MRWTAFAVINGRGGMRTKTMRFDGKPVPVTDFFYGLQRVFGSDQPAYYLVTWRNGRWTQLFRRFEAQKLL